MYLNLNSCLCRFINHRTTYQWLKSSAEISCVDLFRAWPYIDSCNYIDLASYVSVQKSKPISSHFKIYSIEIHVHVCGFFIMGDQCSWLSRVTLAHKFTSPQTYVQAFVWYLHVYVVPKLSCYQRNYVPTNQENFGNPQTLTPWMNKYIIPQKHVKQRILSIIIVNHFY